MKKIFLKVAVIVFHFSFFTLNTSAQSWNLIGNSGTTAGTNFIGTTDAKDFVFKTNNTEKGRVKSNGLWQFGAGGNLAKIDSAGNLSFAGNAAYKVAGNKYAFQFAGNQNYGLFFNSTLTQYEFRNSTAAPVFFINANNGNGTFNGTLKVGAYTLPATDGTNGQVLKTNGAGVLAWSTENSSQWTTNGSNIFYAPGSVSIGTTSFFSGVKFIVAGGDAIINDIKIGLGGGAISTNTTIGVDALFSNTTGNFNTANGFNSLFFNTTGFQNTGIGANTLFANTTGSNNTANGFSSLYNTTTGSDNTANGSNALYNNSTGAHNTATGSSALNGNTTGNQNEAAGWQSLLLNTTGSFNAANGSNTLQSNTTGSSNTANGSSALLFNTTGNFNTANGTNALQNNTTGNSNTADGVTALQFNLTGSNNVAVGRGALNQNGSKSNLVAIGDSALFLNVAGINNTAIGSKALFTNNGSDNTAVGKQSLLQNTSGNNNTSVGAFSLKNNTTGSSNIANGSYALSSNTTGDKNTAIGVLSLNINTTGSDNTANGYAALNSATISVQNTAIGSQALNSTTTGGANTAGGFKSMFTNVGGADNTAFGNQALFSNTTGNSNVAVGNGALFTNTTGSKNTGLGNNAYVSTGALTNATAIGANALVSSSNSLVLGSINGTNGATSNVNVGIGTTAPTFKLDVVGATNGIRLLSGASGSFTSFQIGRTATDATLGVASSTGLFATDASVGDVILRTESTGQKLLLGNGTGHSTMSINNGKVGIGVTAPTFQLDVLGDAHFNTGNTTDCDLRMQTSNSDIGLFTGGVTNQLGIYNYATSNTLMNILGDGRVGINHVPGSAISTYDNNALLQLKQNGINNAPGATLLSLLTSDNNYIWDVYLEEGFGNILINTDGNGFVASVDYSDGSWSSFSDLRLKKDIQNIPSVLDGVRKLNPVSYRLLKNKPTDNLIFGFIAQDVLKVFPELVKSVHINKEEEYYTLNYNNFAVYSIKAIQELDSVISTKEEKIENLESTDAEIQSHLNITDETLSKLDSINKVQQQSITTLNSLSNRNDQLATENENLKNTVGDLKNELAQMKTQMQQFDQSLSQCCMNYNSSTQTGTINPKSETPLLEQNIPNPFSQNTIIKYYLPQTAKSGVIKIYSLEGVELKSFSFTQTGFGQVTVTGSSLPSGVFVYTLVIDGKAIDTKQMILTKN